MLTPERRDDILQTVLRHLKTAGSAGFASMCFFGMVRRKHSGGMAIRRAASVYNILEAIAGSEEYNAIERARVDLDEFKAELDEPTCARIKKAGDAWFEVMSAYWARETARIRDARVATE